MIRDFSPCTSRGYEFTVSKENTIKINTGDYLYETDLTGALLNKKEISDCTYDELNEINKHRFVTSEGSEYVEKCFAQDTYFPFGGNAKNSRI